MSSTRKPASDAALQLYGIIGSGLSRVFWKMGRRVQDQLRHDAFHQLMASQWWSGDHLRDNQWDSLMQLLEHAYEHVPYYRDVFRSLDARPGDFRTPNDLAHLPLLTKDIIQTEGMRLRAGGTFVGKGVYTNHTGGSTGTPLTFLQDATYRAWGMAELDRNFWMCGYRPGQRQAFLWGSDYDSKAHESIRGKLHDLILNLRWVNTFDLDSETLRKALKELVRFRPHLIVGYVSSLTLLAQLIEGEGLAAPQPRAVQTSAEVLTMSARKLIERALSARCFDRYGCREVGNIAHECEAHDGLHLLIENNYIEFVRDDGTLAAPGSAGQVVVTNLRNRIMPFIRYATEDIGVPSARYCKCARGLPLMDSVEGRVSDIIVAPGGKLLHGEFFTHLFYGVAGIRQFQVEQLTLTDLVVRMVAESDEAFEGAKGRLGELINQHGDPQFRLKFARVGRIPPRKSGKYCFTLSHVPVRFRRASPRALAR
jgi:phenylacetate-CoA ligase